MGTVINQKKLTPSALVNLKQPVILCASWNVYEKTIINAGACATGLNLPLAKKLAGKSLTEIHTNVTTSIFDVLPMNEFIYLKNYEALFDPRYGLDVIRLFCEIARRKKLIVKWCGSYNNGSLTYAEQGYDDYAVYKISDYEISCVV